MIGHRDPEAMAKVLCAYIPCDRTVLRHVRGEFETTQLGPRHIAEIRKSREREIDFLRRGRTCKHIGAQWDWRGTEARADAEIASQVFVKAIERERAA